MSPSVYHTTTSNPHRHNIMAHCHYTSICIDQRHIGTGTNLSGTGFHLPLYCRQSLATPDRIRVAKVKL
jgi:hypothetical protein